MSLQTGNLSELLEVCTYVCGHREPNLPSRFVRRLLDKQLIRLPDDQQLLICCSSCMRKLPAESKSGIIVAALAPAISEGNKDAMTVMIIFANLWADFYENRTDEAITLLHMVFVAIGKTYHGEDGMYRKVLNVIWDRFPPLLPLDVFSTVTTSKIDPKERPPNNVLQRQWEAYERANSKFVERVRRISNCHTFYPSDLTKLVDGVLQQGIGFVAVVLAPPQEEHLHFDIVRGWCKVNPGIGEAALIKLRDIMRETATLTRQLRIKLHQVSWQKKFEVQSRQDLENLKLKIGAVNAMARQIRKMDLEKRRQWEEWREVSKKWDPLIEDVLQQRGRKGRSASPESTYGSNRQHMN